MPLVCQSVYPLRYRPDPAAFRSFRPYRTVVGPVIFEVVFTSLQHGMHRSISTPKIISEAVIALSKK
jgi:hypothetical protein